MITGVFVIPIVVRVGGSITFDFDFDISICYRRVGHSGIYIILVAYKRNKLCNFRKNRGANTASNISGSVQ